jgi:hypothetical protein
MRLSDVKYIAFALREEIGWTWPLFLAKCLFRSSSVFHSTHWAKERGAESEYAKRLSITVALHRALIEKAGRERALETMRGMLVPASVDELRQVEHSLDASRKKGMEKLLALWRSFDRGGGLGQLNRGGFIRQESDLLHYRVTDCFFARFYEETGTPELTRLLCESDREYWPQAAPGFEFHRGDSWENTIAYGKDCCEYVFVSKH